MLQLSIKFFTLSFIIPLWDSATAHSPSCKELNLSTEEDTRFSGRCTLAYNFYFILYHPSLELSNSSLTLQYRAQAFLSGKCPFFRALHLGIQISFCPASSLFGTQRQLTHSPLRSSSLPLWKNHVSQGSLLRNVLKLCLGLLWFGTHPYYSLNPYMHLYYLWSISIAKDRYYPKYFIICAVYFYSERLPLCRGV